MYSRPPRIRASSSKKIMRNETDGARAANNVRTMFDKCKVAPHVTFAVLDPMDKRLNPIPIFLEDCSGKYVCCVH